jgi:hypothetical protein
VNSLDIIRMIISPGSSHTTGMDVVGHHVAVLGEHLLAESAESILRGNLPVEELPHFGVRPKLPVSAGMMRVFNAPNAHLALGFLFLDRLSAAAEERTVKRAQLIPAKSHEVLLIGLGVIVYWDGQETGSSVAATGTV